MRRETIKFNYGDILVSDKTISFVTNHKGVENNQTMDRGLVGAINNTEYTYLPLQVMQYGFRFGFGGFIVTGVGIVLSVWNDFNLVFWVGAIAFFFGIFLIFGDMLDALFGTNITTSICMNLFGRKGYWVTIQNNSGGDHIKFLINYEELHKAKNLINFRKENAGMSIQKIDELAALLELKNQGILTEAEYNFKKRQILNG